MVFRYLPRKAPPLSLPWLGTTHSQLHCGHRQARLRDTAAVVAAAAAAALVQVLLTVEPRRFELKLTAVAH
jgi:hypothetical protein